MATRAAIRGAIAALLETVTGLAGKVKQGRPSVVKPAGCPLAFVYHNGGTFEPHTKTGPTTRTTQDTEEFVVELYVTTPDVEDSAAPAEAAVEDALDALVELVRAKLDANQTLSGAVWGLMVTGYEPAVDVDGQDDFAGAQITVRVMQFTTRSA